MRRLDEGGLLEAVAIVRLLAEVDFPLSDEGVDKLCDAVLRARKFVEEES